MSAPTCREPDVGKSHSELCTAKSAFTAMIVASHKSSGISLRSGLPAVDPFTSFILESSHQRPSQVLDSAK